MSNCDRPQASREHLNLFDRAATRPAGTAPHICEVRRAAWDPAVSGTGENSLTDALTADGTAGPAGLPSAAGRDMTVGAGRNFPPYGQADHARVTPAGADWLASASIFPRSVHALWRLRPTAPSVLPCGTAFDVVSTPPLFGRRLLDRLWASGPGSGPVAVHRGRMLLFAAPGTADRLPALLGWEEWQTRQPSSATDPYTRGPASPTGPRPAPRSDPSHPSHGEGPGPGETGETLPALLCHGPGEAVTVPALNPHAAHTGSGTQDAAVPARSSSRWLVAPGVRHPWLPGPGSLLWACFRPGRPGTGRRDRAAGGTQSSPPSFHAGRSGMEGRTIDFHPGGS